MAGQVENTDSRMTTENDGRYALCILSLLVFSQLVMSIGAYAWGPLAPFLRSAFGITRAQTGAIVSVLYGVSTVVATPSGIAVDRYGAKATLIFALASMGVAIVASSTVSSFAVFIVVAGFAGIGYGMINQICSKGIIRWFGRGTRATAMGIKQTGVTLGAAVGGVLLPFLAVVFNWRWALVATGIMILAMAVLVGLLYREHPGRPVEAARPAASDPAKDEARSRRAELWRLFQRPELLSLCFLAMLMAASQISISSFLVLYMGEELGQSPGRAGIFLSVLMTAGTFGRLIWGVISDRAFHGDRQYPLIILCLMAFGSAVGMVFVSKSSPPWLLYMLCTAMGFTFMGWNALFVTYTAEIAGPTLVGLVTGVAITVAWTGIIAGPFLFGLIADRAGYSWGWSVLALAGLSCSAAVFLSARVSGRQGAKARNPVLAGQ